MPFYAGTAAIAEMSLNVLLIKYFPDLIFTKNPNVMIDVEALSLPYSLFANNFFESDGTEYTPYYSIQ